MLGGDDHGGWQNGREGHAALLFVLPANKEGNTRRWRPKEGPVRARHQLARLAARQRQLRSAVTGACHWRRGRWLSGDGHLANIKVRGSTRPRYCACACAWTGYCDGVRTRRESQGWMAARRRARSGVPALRPFFIPFSLL
jgi:hypothetical protein